VILSDLPAGTRPIVQVIDNPVRCERLGLIFELAVGSGRLLVCAADLDALAAEHPEAAQLRASLLAYAASPAFSPANHPDSERDCGPVYTVALVGQGPNRHRLQRPARPSARPGGGQR